jgi:acetyltransferase-like isoleucine patch superfamily enzyme
MDSDGHPLGPVARRALKKPKTAPVVIDEDAFIGARAIILKGVHIGRGAVIGAGAVVAADVPELSIVAGNPARTVGKVREADTSNAMGSEDAT